MTKTTAIELYEILVYEGYFTNEELKLLTNINGLSIETLNDAIYARYGYRDYEQMKESEEEWRKKKMRKKLTALKVNELVKGLMKGVEFVEWFIVDFENKELKLIYKVGKFIYTCDLKGVDNL